jgi:hypothetical protein
MLYLRTYVHHQPRETLRIKKQEILAQGFHSMLAEV